MARWIEDSEKSIVSAFSAVRAIPTLQGDVSITNAASALLVADASATNGYGTRRITITNTDATNTLGVKVILAAGTVTGHALSTMKRILPLQTFEINLGTNLRLVAATSAGTIVANVFVSDLV